MEWNPLCQNIFFCSHFKQDKLFWKLKRTENCEREFSLWRKTVSLGWMKQHGTGLVNSLFLSSPFQYPFCLKRKGGNKEFLEFLEPFHESIWSNLSNLLLERHTWYMVHSYVECNIWTKRNPNYFSLIQIVSSHFDIVEVKASIFTFPINGEIFERTLTHTKPRKSTKVSILGNCEALTLNLDFYHLLVIASILCVLSCFVAIDEDCFSKRTDILSANLSIHPHALPTQIYCPYLNDVRVCFFFLVLHLIFPDLLEWETQRPLSLSLSLTLILQRAEYFICR